MNSKNFVITKQNVEEYITKISNWLKDQLLPFDGAVVGMSGGVDSTLVALLLHTAKIKTHLILMPYGESKENEVGKKDAMELINNFGFQYSIKDIKPAVDALLEANTNRLSQINIRPRIRMTYLYHYAQAHNLAVVGTGNLSESTVGYFTKWGDGAYDFNPIGMLTKREVYIMAEALGAPKNILVKPASADLFEGQTDEGDLGFSYNDLDNFILNGGSGDTKIDESINKREMQSMHKKRPIAIFNEERVSG